MRVAAVVCGLIFMGLSGCESGAAPSAPAPTGGPPSGDLDGRWGWDENLNPGGIARDLTLATAGDSVRGTGAIGSEGSSAPGVVTIEGQHVVGFGPFFLTVRNGSGYVATYLGQFVNQDQIHGTWTEGTQSYSMTFDRCPPAQLCGSP